MTPGGPDPFMELQTLRKDLAAGRRSLAEIWQGRSLLWQRLGWDRPQVRLWLRSLPEMAVQDADSADPSYGIGAGPGPDAHREASRGTFGAAPKTDDLGEIIARTVDALGGQVPLAMLRGKLPPGLVVTDPMLRAAVQAHPGLTMIGPLVRLVR
jgi:hypothetical protein